MKVIAGVDEVGTGSLAGPYISVVAAFNEDGLSKLPNGVKDSKQTTFKQREILSDPIKNCALCIGIGYAWPWEIDRYSPGVALQLCYKRALEELTIEIDELIVDGINYIDCFDRAKQRVIVKADSLHKEVSAASIVAKNFRDKIMIEISNHRKHLKLPTYFWDNNKGYGTKEHQQQIEKYGLVVEITNGQQDNLKYIHRLSYCKSFLKDTHLDFVKAV